METILQVKLRSKQKLHQQKLSQYDDLQKQISAEISAVSLGKLRIQSDLLEGEIQALEKEIKQIELQVLKDGNSQETDLPSSRPIETAPEKPKRARKQRVVPNGQPLPAGPTWDDPEAVHLTPKTEPAPTAGQPPPAKSVRSWFFGLRIEIKVVLLTGLFSLAGALIAGIFSVASEGVAPIIAHYLIARETQAASVQMTSAAETASPTFTRPATTVTPTATPTYTPSASPTTTQTATPAPTLTPPSPEVILQELVEQESRAVLSKNLELIKTIFLPDAVRVNTVTGEKNNAIEWYQENFDTGNPDRYDFTASIHLNNNITLQGNKAVMTNDSCGSFFHNGVQSTYNNVQSDRWSFERDAQGRWWISEFAFNQPYPGPEIVFSFEEIRSECLPWAVRYIEGIPQGLPPELSIEEAFLGKGSLRFDIDTGANKTRQGQIVAYNISFSGKASAYVFVPEGVMSKLKAGFFAQDFPMPPWNLHPATQYTALEPGKWTKVTWDVAVKGWQTEPMHLIGLEIRDTSGAYHGPVYIDEVHIITR